MKKILLSALIISAGLFNSGSSFAQISAGGTPPGFNKFLVDKEIPLVSMPAFDVEAMLAEDEVIHPQKIGPYRFGNNFNVYLTPTNSGTWTTLENGDRLWQLGIQSAGAYSINLTFTDYLLPEGAKLFVYNKERDFVIGAFTNANNQEDRLFATDLVKGEHIIVEYYEPKSVADQGSIIISMVTHAYRDLFSEDFSRAFGSSGSCNMNVNCPDGAPWQDQKRSGIMLVSGGNGFCSAALVNNTQNNGIPYVLTANHCGSSGFGSWVFRFNWEATGCPNPGSSPTYQSITGSVSRASLADSDFRLVEMSSIPPSNYNVYYAGWNNVNSPPDSSVSIHHPSGDIKKISFDDNPAVSAQGLSTVANSEWRVIWDRNTTTEGGSSGSPLFDQNKRIIGQLHGGGASCTNLTAPDYYGKFSMSWNTGTTASTRLRDWLDPNTTGVTVLDGYDPNAPTLALDAGIQSTTTPTSGSSTCNTSVTPQVVLRNAGTTTLTACDINYQMDGGTIQIYNWTGSLASNSTVGVTLNAFSGLSVASHTFKSYTSNPNASTDQNALNDTSTVVFSVITPNPVVLTPQLEDFQSTFPSTNWTIGNPNGNDTWVKVTTAGGFGASSASAKMDNFTNDMTGESDFIYSPYLDLTNSIAPISLTFDVAYARYNATYYDSLKVKTTTNCGSTWTQVYAKGNTVLATAPDVTTSFTPTSTQWRTETVNLDSYAGQSAVRLAFENKSGWGQNLYIDNVNITGGVITSISSDNINSIINIYPNPGNGYVSAEIKLKSASEKLTIDVYSVLGEKVYAISDSDSKGGVYKMDLSHLSSGLYFIEVSTDNEKIVEKHILKKN